MNPLRPVRPDQIPPQLVETYRFYAFEQLDHSPAFAYATAGEWAAIADHFANGVLDAVRGVPDKGGLVAAETEHAEKLATFWRDKGYGSAVQDGPIDVDIAGQGEWLRPELRKIGIALSNMIRAMGATRVREIADAAPIPIDRGKAAPFWLPSSHKVGGVLLYALWRDCDTYEDYVRNLQDSGPVTLPLSATTYIRIQGGRKLIPAWATGPGGIYKSGERWGPKNRKIQALPFGVNTIQARVAAVTRKALALLDDRNTGTLGPALRASRTNRYTIAYDYSGYDASIAFQTLAAFHDEVFRRCVDACVATGVIGPTTGRLCIESDVAVSSYGLLGPPTSYNDAAVIAPMRGTIISGKRWTSLEGTIINRAIRNAQMRESGLRATIINSGDDTIVCTNDRAGLARFQTRINQHGIKEVEAPSSTYLMRHLPEGYAYLGRMLDGTLNREANREPTSVAQAALGMVVRNELLKGHPAAGAYYDLIASAPSDALRGALSLARAATPTQLTEIALRQLTRGVKSQVVEELTTMIEDGMSLGLLPMDTLSTAAVTLGVRGPLPHDTDTLKLLQHRSTLSSLELESLVRLIPLDYAKRVLRKQTDFRRPK